MAIECLNRLQDYYHLYYKVVLILYKEHVFIHYLFEGKGQKRALFSYGYMFYKKEGKFK